MYQLARVAAAATIASLVLTACGGGGSSTTPSQPVKPAATPAPSAASRTAVGTAKITLALPQVLTAKGKAVRAISRISGRATQFSKTASKSPQFVDPSPNPLSAGPCGGPNVIDIYVDGTLLSAIDGGPEGSDSLCVQPGKTGRETATLPLYSTAANTIVAVEWDALGQNVLAIGESDFGGFAPGNVQNVSLTMLMNAFGVGIVDLSNPSGALLMTPSTEFAPAPGPCPGSSQFAVYPTDALGNFIPAAGSGGTSTATITGTSANGGTSKFSASSVPGVYVAPVGFELPRQHQREFERT